MPTLNETLKASLPVLKHFSTFANSIMLKPGEPMCAKRSTNTLVAWTSAPYEAEHTLPIYDLGNFVNAIRTFGDNATFEIKNDETGSYIEMIDQSFRQSFYLSEPELIEAAVPRWESVQRYISMPFDIEFDIDSEALSRLQKAKAVVRGNFYTLVDDGSKLKIVFAEFDDDGNFVRSANKFEYEIGDSLGTKATIGLPEETFSMIATGSYHVKANSNLITLSGKDVSYLLPIALWSSVGEG